jgi:hypothetical protein
MVKTIRVSLMFIGLLPLSVALADSAYSPDRLDDSSPQTTATAQASMPLMIPDARFPFSSLNELTFHDSSAFGRAKNIRSLSLLTLAEFKKSHLYLGINKRGLFGLHFNATQQSDARCLEVARMPYLEKRDTE